MPLAEQNYLIQRLQSRRLRRNGYIAGMISSVCLCASRVRAYALSAGASGCEHAHRPKGGAPQRVEHGGADMRLEDEVFVLTA